MWSSIHHKIVCCLINKLMFALQEQVLRRSRSASRPSRPGRPGRPSTRPKVRSKSRSVSKRSVSKRSVSRRSVSRKVVRKKLVSKPKKQDKQSKKNPSTRSNIVEFKLHYVLLPYDTQDTQDKRVHLPTTAQFNKFYKDYLTGFFQVYEYHPVNTYKIQMFDKYMLVTLALRVPAHHKGQDEQDFIDMLANGDDDGNYPVDNKYYFHVVRLTDSRRNQR